MGLRISIGVIIAVLLGGTGYFAQQSQSTKELLKKQEIALSREKENSVKLKNDIRRLKNLEQKMKGLESGRAKVDTATEARIEELNRLVAEKTTGTEQDKAKIQSLETALKESQATLDDERKARAEVEKSNQRNIELASNRADEIRRLKTEAEEMSQRIAEKTAAAELIKNQLDQTNLNLAETIRKNTHAVARSKALENRAHQEAERAKKLESDLNKMNSKLKEQLVSLKQTKDLLRVTFVNNLLFASGSARLKEKGLEALSSVAEFLQKQKDKMIRIEGHTDNQPIKASLRDRYPSNWELSFARAVSIVKFLESKNISPARMSATGRSFYHPVTSNDTEAGRAKNRRTVIFLSSPRPTVEGDSR